MKKHLHSSILVLLMIAVIPSCKKSFLDEQLLSAISPSTLNDSLGFEAEVVGLYSHFSTFFTYANAQGWPAVWQTGTDVAFSTQPQGIEVPYYNYSTLTSTDAGASYSWNWAYRAINNANNIIVNIEDPSLISLSTFGKNYYNAEARFFRGYAYNVLATLFGGVPLVTQPVSTPKTDYVRSSLDSVNNLIVSDLLFAITNLPDIDNVKSNAKGRMHARPHKAMAQHLLAEVYLRMGKPDLAEQQAQAVINSGKFSLITARYGVRAGQAGDPFADMFVYGNQRRAQGNREGIFVMEIENPQSVSGVLPNSQSPQQRRVWGAAYHNITGMKIADSLGGRGVARLRLSNWVLYNLYPANDMRNSRFNIRREFWYNDPTKPATFGKPVPYTGPDTLWKIMPYTTKWGAFDPNDEFGYAMIKDIIVMRLGETYLLLAEALVKQNKLPLAADAINVLRTRANAPLVTAAQMTLDFVLDERARELVGEENRRMTLMRTGKLVERAIALNSSNGPGTNAITGLTNKHLLLPIPQSEIDLNKDARLEQNPNY